MRSLVKVEAGRCGARRIHWARFAASNSCSPAGDSSFAIRMAVLAACAHDALVGHEIALHIFLPVVEGDAAVAGLKHIFIV